MNRRETRLDIRTEIGDTDEIVIRCRERNDAIRSLETMIGDLVQGHDALSLLSAGTAYLIPKAAVLFFESNNGKVYAHTRDGTYTAPYKLYELEDLLPACFVRVSKSAIVNLTHVFSVRRELVGNGELSFRGCKKTVFFSRAYYKLLQYKLQEMRLKP